MRAAVRRHWGPKPNTPQPYPLLKFVSLPHPGLHNPIKNVERYNMLGAVMADSAREMAKPEVRIGPLCSVSVMSLSVSGERYLTLTADTDPSCRIPTHPGYSYPH